MHKKFNRLHKYPSLSHFLHIKHSLCSLIHPSAYENVWSPTRLIWFTSLSDCVTLVLVLKLITYSQIINLYMLDFTWIDSYLLWFTWSSHTQGFGSFTDHTQTNINTIYIICTKVPFLDAYNKIQSSICQQSKTHIRTLPNHYMNPQVLYMYSL